MGLNTSTGNMYSFVSHTFNTIKGQCYHDCSYCFCKRWGAQKPVRFDDKELKTDLGSGNFIFVGSSCDMFAVNIPTAWIIQTLNHCKAYPNNSYLLQTKNPKRILENMELIPKKTVICTTIETNRKYPEIMRNSPDVTDRANAMNEISQVIDTYVTCEPLIDFDLDEMVELIFNCHPKQCNVGADSGNNNLPEPSKEKVLALISELQKFTIIHNKKNLSRLLK